MKNTQAAKNLQDFEKSLLEKLVRTYGISLETLTRQHKSRFSVLKHAIQQEGHRV